MSYQKIFRELNLQTSYRSLVFTDNEQVFSGIFAWHPHTGSGFPDTHQLDTHPRGWKIAVSLYNTFTSGIVPL